MSVCYEMVAGLEVHVELATESKIFCGCTTKFGGEPNTHICPVCTGMPGALPVLNRQVLEFAIRTGVTLSCDITRVNKFDRKNYYYPDLPKAYQISQLYLPICRNGSLEVEADGGTKTIRIHEIHMEEDAGKLVHDHLDNYTSVDYNRCGVPLLEIVSEPDFRSAGEIISYLEKLREILIYLGVSDCKMQEGSMRADVNLSVREPGGEMGTRTEMKNMNSIKAIHRAVLYETARQIELLESGGSVVQETRRWDDDKGESFSMRTKENAQEYRYFPEPDLLPMEISEAWIESVAANIPELPEQKRARYRKDMGLSEPDAEVLTSARELARLFEETTALCNEPREAANLIIVEIMRLCTDSATPAESIKIDAKKIAALIELVVNGKINRTVSKQVLERIFYDDADPLTFVREQGLLMLDDPELLARTVSDVLSENSRSIEDYKSGKEKAFGYLMGQIMRALKNKADPKAVSAELRAQLDRW